MNILTCIGLCLFAPDTPSDLGLHRCINVLFARILDCQDLRLHGNTDTGHGAVEIDQQGVGPDLQNLEGNQGSILHLTVEFSLPDPLPDEALFGYFPDQLRIMIPINLLGRDHEADFLTRLAALKGLFQGRDLAIHTVNKTGEILSAMAQAYFGKNKFAQAIKYSKKAIEKPHDDEISERSYFLLAFCYSVKKDKQKEQYFIDKLERLKPNSPYLKELMEEPPASL